MIAFNALEKGFMQIERKGGLPAEQINKEVDEYLTIMMAGLSQGMESRGLLDESLK